MWGSNSQTVRSWSEPRLRVGRLTSCTTPVPLFSYFYEKLSFPEFMSNGRCIVNWAYLLTKLQEAFQLVWIYFLLIFFIPFLEATFKMDPFLILYSSPNSLEAKLPGKRRGVLGGQAALEDKARWKQALYGNSHVGTTISRRKGLIYSQVTASCGDKYTAGSWRVKEGTEWFRND